MTTSLFNPGPTTFVSPAGGVFAVGDHFESELDEVTFAAVQRGRLLVVETAETLVMEPAGADVATLPPVTDGDPDAAPGDDIVEVDSEDEIVIDDTPADELVIPKPGPASKTTKTEKKD